MKKFRAGLLLVTTSLLLGGCDFLSYFTEPDIQEEETPVETTLVSIVASNYKESVEQNKVYVFDGVVNACYSDNSAKQVTSYKVANLDTSTVGVKDLIISYTEKDVTVSTTIKITVQKAETEEIETVSAEEAVAIIDKLEVNVISKKEYYVRGIVASGVELDNNGFNGTFLNTNLKFRSTQGNGIASKVEDIRGKEVVILGYLENYNSIYQIPYLPANYSPTGEKYNSKLISVKEVESEEVPVSDISISPVNKVLEVNEESTLTVTFYPQSATNKSLTWKSSDTSVCTVSSTGLIKGISAGDALITATSNNGKEATCNVSVVKSQPTPIDGDKFVIEFNHFESDGQTELTSSTVLDQITAGSSYISSVDSISKVYKGMNGLKFGSSRTGGSMLFTLSNSLGNFECKQIILETVQYGDKSTTVTLYANDEQVVSDSSSSAKITGVFEQEKVLKNIKISTSSRAYISKITFVCDELEAIPVTSISIPSEKTISIGGSETLNVTYVPSNANVGKDISWKSSATTVASVLNGKVTAVSAGTAIITATTEKGLTATCKVTVSNISVTGVTLSSTSETLNIGASKQLTATISPSNATNKEVIWTSSNTSVATVKDGLVSANAVGNTTITVKTVDGNKTATCYITVESVSKDAWTIMIYMCGADLESESGLASGDIKEILSVKNQPSDVNILIETGGAKSWSLPSTNLSGATSIDSSKLCRWHVENKKLVLDEKLSSYTSMGSSSTLQSFVQWGIEEYPAEKTGVIFWNHGGAMYGCCYDEKKNDDSLTNSEMKTAFSNALKNTGSSKLEFVGYDTCLTQVQDIAEFNSNYFNYMIASEEAEAGEGWDYDTWVDDLYAKKSTDVILKAIVDGFITDNGGASSTRSDQTLSYLDLSKMSAYKTAFESFASALKTQLTNKNVSKSTFASWMDKNVKAFAVDSESSECYYCLFDVKDMVNKILNNSTYNPGSSYTSSLLTAFSNLVKYSVAQKGAGNAYGLGCIYAQSSIDSYYIKQAYTSSETNFTNWLSFCKSFSYLG